MAHPGLCFYFDCLQLPCRALPSMSVQAYVAVFETVTETFPVEPSERTDEGEEREAPGEPPEAEDEAATPQTRTIEVDILRYIASSHPGQPLLRGVCAVPPRSRCHAPPPTLSPRRSAPRRPAPHSPAPQRMRCEALTANPTADSRPRRLSHPSYPARPPHLRPTHAHH